MDINEIRALRVGQEKIYKLGLETGQMKALGKLIKRIEEQRNKQDNETLEMILHWIVEIENEKE